MAGYNGSGGGEGSCKGEAGSFSCRISFEYGSTVWHVGVPASGVWLKGHALIVSFVLISDDTGDNTGLTSTGTTSNSTGSSLDSVTQFVKDHIRNLIFVYMWFTLKAIKMLRESIN